MASPYSVSRRTGLSFRERPLASCPGRAPRLPHLSGPAGGWLPPNFIELQKKFSTIRPIWSNRPTTTLAGDSRYSRFPGLKTDSALRVPCLLSSGATRLVPRFFPTGASISRCREFRTFGAPPCAPELGLGPFSLVGTPRGHAPRLARRGIPQRTSVPSAPPRKGASPLCTEVQRVRFDSQGAPYAIRYARHARPYPLLSTKSPQYSEVVEM